MNLKPVLMLALLFTQLSFATDSFQRIVGGAPVDKGEYPFMVSLQNNSSHFCGGSLIAKNWVLTAAHCAKATSVEKLQIKVGLHNQSDTQGTESFTAEKIVPHPEYDSSKTDYDFALIQLKGESKFAHIELNRGAIDIPEEEEKAPMSTTAGWGTTSEWGSLSKELLKVEVPLVSGKRCEVAYPGKITKTMICAGFEKGGKDSCQGDSGGPLMIKDGNGGNVLIGVVSWGAGCARPKKYGVYADLYTVLSWIESRIAQ